MHVRKSVSSTNPVEQVHVYSGGDTAFVQIYVQPAAVEAASQIQLWVPTVHSSASVN